MWSVGVGVGGWSEGVGGVWSEGVGGVECRCGCVE